MTDSLRKDVAHELELLKHEARGHRTFAMRLELILRIYIYFGIVIASGALAYFGLSFLKIELTAEQRMSLIVAGAGISVSVMSAALLAIRRQQAILRSDTYLKVEQGYDLVREWATFEENSRRVLEDKGIEFNARSPRFIVSMLESHNLVSSDLAKEISAALDVRNRVVHQAAPVPQPEIEDATHTLSISNATLNLILDSADKTQNAPMPSTSREV
ncbi:hypothetical protein BMI86_13865 [Thioclava sp. DLFJ5-1]|uniref:hypothetical protein n=1 Tax=Thioclava sp. DLFJ5-1 TaxID=1915314 RepID=UPI000996D492|nr:hypothetical protein [Thioclava sp. DLFJ5-1]OOY19709.1 hypothetical protein BMI86_13865 [Thioclava sp. DLFJ5-1]